jgi:hypothetical protein
MKLLFDQPWYVIFACVIVSAALAALLYFKNRRNREAPRYIIWTLVGLRFAALLLIALLFAGLLLRQVRNETEYPKVILAIDNSSSMTAGGDSLYVKEKLSEQLEKFSGAVGEKYQVQKLYFGSQTSASVPAQPFTDKETDIDDLLRTIANNYANENIGAVVLVSDGIYNKGANPAFSAPNLPYPVHVLAVGDTAERPDLVLKKVDHNQVAYLGNNFPVEVQISAKKFKGSKTKVELLKDGQVFATREIEIMTSNFSATLNFTLSAASPGIQKYSARISGESSENNKLNNRQDFIVEVIDNKEKILLIAQAPHPDIGAIREAVAGNTAYDLELAYTGEATKNVGGYNLVIIHGYAENQAAIVDDCRKNNVPFWIIDPSIAQGLPGIKISTSLNRFNDAEPVFDETFGYFTISDALRKFLRDLPAVKTFFGNYSLPQGSSPMLRQRLGSVETEQPLLYFNSTEGIKYGVFLGEGLWRWKLRDHVEHYNTKLFAEFISKCIQYLSAKTDKSFFRVSAPRISDENNPVEFDAELYNKAYEPINDPDVLMSITNKKNEKFNYTFSKTSNAYHLTIGSVPAGDYRYKTSVTLAGETFTKEGSLVIREMVAERLMPVANHGMLRQLSARSGGQFYEAAEIQKLIDKLSESGSMKAVVYSSTLTRPLIDKELLFFIILGAFAIEWFLRKRYLII